MPKNSKPPSRPFNLRAPTLEERVRKLEKRVSKLKSTVRTFGMHGRLDSAGPDPAAPAVLTREEFCVRNRISKSGFYAQVRAGIGPRTFNVGRGIRITLEAEQEWRRRMETGTGRLNKRKQ